MCMYKVSIFQQNYINMNRVLNYENKPVRFRNICAELSENC